MQRLKIKKERSANRHTFVSIFFFLRFIVTFRDGTFQRVSGGSEIRAARRRSQISETLLNSNIKLNLVLQLLRVNKNKDVFFQLLPFLTLKGSFVFSARG